MKKLTPAIRCGTCQRYIEAGQCYYVPVCYYVTGYEGKAYKRTYNSSPKCQNRYLEKGRS